MHRKRLRLTFALLWAYGLFRPHPGHLKNVREAQKRSAASAGVGENGLIELIHPAPATKDQLLDYHSPEYVRHLCSFGGYSEDDDREDDSDEDRDNDSDQDSQFHRSNERRARKRQRRIGFASGSNSDHNVDEDVHIDGRSENDPWSKISGFCGGGSNKSAATAAASDGTFGRFHQPKSFVCQPI